MSNKWTPGPWTAASGFVFQSDEERAACIARDPNWCEIIGGKYPMPEGFSVSGHCGLANAHLIAAAPELYEALIRCLEYIENDETTHGRPFGEGNEARAALAKARGEP